MDVILERIVEAKATWQRAHPDQNPGIVAVGEKAARALKLTLPEAKHYDPSTITFSARVFGLHVEEDPEMPEDAIEVR